MSTTLNYATVFTPDEVLTRSAVVISDKGTIEYVGPMDSAPRVDGLNLDMRGRYVIPGLIDVHVHGGFGVGFGTMEALAEDLQKYASKIVENGVTGFITSIATPDAPSLLKVIKAYVKLFEKGVRGAEPLGMHLEGPFLSREKKGAFHPEWLRDPVLEEARSFLDAGQGWISQMTLAPELPLAQEVASMFRQEGVVVAMGHTNADFETARMSLQTDFTHVTHTFNAQRGFHHREPGVFGAILSSDEITAELIADTIHVHPGAMKTLYRCLGDDRIVLITDAILGAGLPDGTYTSVEFTVTIKDGVVTLEDGTLAGSSARLNQCVRNMHETVGVPLHQAIKMASLNPARAMGFASRLGSVTPGKDANLTVIDEDVNVFMTLVKGEIVYNQL
jgi:N-acetylglucosamine-6-phosphate deacetylase